LLSVRLCELSLSGISEPEEERQEIEERGEVYEQQAELLFAEQNSDSEGLSEDEVEDIA